jgi:hypothetical protein
MRVQDSQNNPQVRNTSTLGKIHAFLVFFLQQLTLLRELAALLVD